MDFVINGRKWMITGVPEASDQHRHGAHARCEGKDLGATMFFVDMDAPGFRVDRMLETIDTNSPGGHAEVSFKAVHVTPDRVLGQIGQGFRNAQVRLGPARLDALHALARRGAALPRHRGGICRTAPLVRPHDRRAPRRRLHVGRQ